MEEGRRLARVTRTSKDPVRLRQYVREVIHAFNERGFDALDPEWSADAQRRSVSGSV